MTTIPRRFLERFFKSPGAKGGFVGIIQGLFMSPPSRLNQGGAAALPRRKANCQGFTLLEVMVATAIMGLVLVVLLQVLSGAMMAQETAIGHARALQTADRVLQDSCNALDMSSRQYSGQDGPYSYQVKITPQYEVAVPATLDRLVRCSLIQVTVSWPERGRTPSVSLETIRTASQQSR
jgi:prepilin-type N-terminal cleavage/methylation domain-containing protein